MIFGRWDYLALFVVYPAFDLPVDSCHESTFRNVGGPIGELIPPVLRLQETKESARVIPFVSQSVIHCEQVVYVFKFLLSLIGLVKNAERFGITPL